MVFNSIFFIFCFLPVFMLVYYLVPGKLRNLILFLGSLIFLCLGRTGLCGSHAVFQCL